ncbi:mannose-6-phosphate isomerase [Thioflavicoccus mobilis 8321]|uniref:Mannose-6-phosphate isomerase n=1 Tax=Thioflavicoccus mobilis 8321 TaxID=765912 RepID=L0GUE9_9GAMM|nr:cupin domain-containing protein [Thioflavicoccus mobilis]AGA90403.1 mannose-6-phosphate isomerase [Thioflavicoccus mobilis 8321]
MTTIPPRVHHPDESMEFFTDEGCAILETWNRPEDEAVSIARARVPARQTTRLHRLHGIEERYLIVSGCGQVEVGGHVPTLVQSGDLVYIPAGCTQRITSLGEEDLVFFAICTPRFVPEAYEDVEEPR